jgi:hypothetical protein
VSINLVPPDTQSAASPWTDQRKNAGDQEIRRRIVSPALLISCLQTSSSWSARNQT